MPSAVLLAETCYDFLNQSRLRGFYDDRAPWTLTYYETNLSLRFFIKSKQVPDFSGI